MNVPARQCDHDVLQQIVARVAAMEDDEALVVLDQALADWPEDARLRFLRGSIQAQTARYDIAEKDFETALALDPGFDIARFQLGLLHLTSGRPGRALRVWEPLDRLDDADCLRLFKTGLTYLIDDRFDDCVRLLQDGIAKNTQFPPLNRDMQMVIDRLSEQRAAVSEADAAAQDKSMHVLLTGYLHSKTKH
jgi:tetratricopeptide (TPR) repeat protein